MTKRTRMYRGLASVVLFIALMPLAGCGSAKGNATVTCSHIEKFHSDMGTVNVPLYDLGKILILSTSGADKRAYGLRTLTIADADKVSGSGAASMTIKLDSSLTVAFDVKIPETVRAQASSAISKGTNINLTNVSRVDLKDPIELADKDASIKSQIKAGAADPNKRFIIVSSVKGADALDLKLDNNTEGKVSADVVKYADVELKVVYQCDGLVRMTGAATKTSIFYGVTPLRYDADSDKLVLDDRPINVWEYDHSNAFGDH